MASSSQNASRNTGLPWTTFQLAKFSHAENESLRDAHIQWTHHPERTNLVLVLDFSRVRISDGRWEDSRVLKVISGAEILEILDLNALVQEALTEGERARELRLQSADLRISIIISSPRIAFRYTTQTGQARRFQLRFISDEVFERAISILRGIGLPIHPAPSSNPSSTGVASSRPMTASQSRPSSSLQDRPYSSQENLLGTTYPRLIPGYNGRNEVVDDRSPLRLLPSPELSRASSSSDLRSTLNYSMPPPDYRHQSAGTLSSTAHPAFGNDHGHFRQGIDAAPRPWTVPTSQASYSLDSLLPPRRELPFGNPTTTTTGPTSKSTIITTGDEATNAMPKAAAADKAGARGAKQPAKTKGRTAKPLQAKKGKNNPRKEVVDSNVETPAELSSTQTPGTMSGVVTESHSTVPAMPSATRAEVGSSSRKRPLTELEAGPNNGRQPGLSTSRGPASDNRFPTQPDRIQAAQPPVNPETVSAEYLDRIDAFVAQHASRPPPPEAANDSLAAYAAQSDEDRLASIDDLICQHLMDDDFLQLCEDVENSWRRIGLGR